MRLLIDNQLPPALARHLCNRGLEAIHVVDIDLDAATDQAIWSFAERENLVIVSKDDDFRFLANQKRSIPPQVVWVRLANCRRAQLIAAFDSVLDDLVAALRAGENLVEIR